MHYKAPDNSLHYLDDEAFVHLLPAGSVPITDEEAEALRPVPQADPKAEAQAYLDSTDWYVVRMAETGVPAPADVTSKRAAARLLLP
jgi:hypothetical protein